MWTRLLKIAAFAAVSLGATTLSAQTDPAAFRYLQHCAGCHLVDGSGVPPEVPNLRSDLGYLLNSPEGRDYMLRVPGVIGVPIPAEEVVDLMNWIITAFYPERTNFEPFTLEEIEAARTRPLFDPLGYRSEMFPDLYPDLSHE